MNVAVIGIGRIGLPVAAMLASKGHRVFGCDIDAGRVAEVNGGGNPIPDEAGLSDLLQTCVRADGLTATTNTAEAVAQCEVVLFAVAVDVENGRADLRSLLAACDDVARGMRPGTTCIFDTTLPIGTTRKVLAPRLESGGLTLGRDFHVAFSPERLLMGRIIEDLGKYPKVVGGVDPEGGKRAAAFYAQLFGEENVKQLANAETAELSKLSEGVYRDLNIALANELAQVADAHGIDINEVIDAANSQPFCHLHTPGTGVGGHCIPVYPQFLMQNESASQLAALGRSVNDAMPGYAVERLEELLGGLEGRRVLILGLTFRPNIAVTPHTNAVDLLREFEARGAIVAGHDALLSEEGVRSLGFEPASEPLAGYDVAVLHANHKAYANLRWADIAPILLDARNALDRTAVEAVGVRYIGVGRPVTAE